MAKQLHIKQLRNSRYSDVTVESPKQHFSPITGYKAVPLVSLEKAIAFVSTFLNGIANHVYAAKANCVYPADGLNQDESASIYLYTMELDSGPSLYRILNEALRAEDRAALKPWFSFLKIFLTALSKLPSCACTVWRGVRDVNFSTKYPRGTKFVWWGVSSCTLNIDVLDSDSFLGKHSRRMLFSIECKDGKIVGSHSCFKNKEQEIILMPGSWFEVIGQSNPAFQLYIIQLKQIDPPSVLVNPSFRNLPPGKLQINKQPSRMLTADSKVLTRMKHKSVSIRSGGDFYIKSTSPAHKSYLKHLSSISISSFSRFAISLQDFKKF